MAILPTQSQDTTGRQYVQAVGAETLEIIEQRRQLANDNGLTEDSLYGIQLSGWSPADRQEGKFFSSGARGYITKIQVMARITVGSGNLVLGVTDAPNSPERFELTKSISNTTFSTIEIEVAQPWDYDGLLIYVKSTTNTSIRIYADTLTPYDTWAKHSGDSFFEPNPNSPDYRMFIRAEVWGKRIGELAVIGETNDKLLMTISFQDYFSVADSTWTGWDIPRWVTHYKIQAREDVDLKISYLSNGATFWTLKAGGVALYDQANPKYLNDFGLKNDGKLYFQSGSGTITVEIEYWGF